MIEPADHQAPVTAYFEDDAPFWRTVYEAEGVFSDIHRERAKRASGVVDGLLLGPGARVLEVGCGAGLNAVELARRGFLVEATDSTPAMIELTRETARSAGVADRLAAHLADVHDLGYQPAAFDLVVALGVIPWLHDPFRALQEMARVTRPPECRSRTHHTSSRPGESTKSANRSAAFSSAAGVSGLGSGSPLVSGQ